MGLQLLKLLTFSCLLGYSPGALNMGETASFDGESYIEFNMSRQAVQTTNNTLKMRFKTERSDSILMYIRGNQRDVIMLEISRGYLKLMIGSTATINGMTQIIASSLLDDNQWHDLVIKIDSKALTVDVDGPVNMTPVGFSTRIDLYNILHLGGVPYFNINSITLKYNFTGCVQNFYLNGAQLVNDAMSEQLENVSIINNVAAYCNVLTKIPVTFPSLESKILITALSGRVIHVAFDFRTYDKDVLMVYHKMSEEASVTVRIDENGYVRYTVIALDQQKVEDFVRNTDVLSPTGTFTDGLWHSFYLYIDSDKINCTVDRNAKVSLRKLSVQAMTEFYLGGYELMNGFRGCMRDIQVDQKYVDLEKLMVDAASRITGAQIGTCSIRDRCTPNPCEHNGFCEQSWNTFTCNCDNTGYQGEVCHTSSYPLSCEMQKSHSNIDGREEAVIDPDGSGPLKTYKAFCERDTTGEIITSIGHDSMGDIRVDGFQDPGSYVRKITYTADGFSEVEEVIDRARTCRQNVLYRCKNARLLANPGIADNPAIKTWGWWVGRTFQPMYYWGGAAPGSFKCKCGLDEDCKFLDSNCYCDFNYGVHNLYLFSNEAIDQGYIVQKEYLPVLELHLGDTGSPTDDKWSEYNIGELECLGDNLFDNTVTFTQKDGALEFPTFEAENAGDIWFQFKTTVSDGVMIHCVGTIVSDFVEIRLFQSDTIQFSYGIGSDVTMVSFKSPSPLNDDMWHTVHVEKNRKQSWIKVDDYPANATNEDPDLIRQLDLTSPLTVGSLVGFGDGYVGSMRALRVNGRLMDMLGKLKDAEVYGVRAGWVGKCASSPCLNDGICREGYDSYQCDCTYTPWKGRNCGQEVGVNLKSNYLVRYTFDDAQSLLAKEFQRVTIGFSTRVKQGILMQMKNQRNTEYISVEINNNGGVKVSIDFGFQRVEVNTPPSQEGDYADGQTHIVVVERPNAGRKFVVQVDNYEPVVKFLNDASSGSDIILDNPKFLFIGSNDTSNIKRGFEGCIFRMKIDNIFPLKKAFQEHSSPYISFVPPDKMKEDRCGTEGITASQEPIKN